MLSIWRHSASLTMVALSLLLALGGCASPAKRPLLYPNTHLNQVGEQAAQQDINACMELARTSNVNEDKDGEVGRKAAGLVRCGGVGSRALAGAAAGATAGAVSGGLQSTETSPLFMNFVNKCLSDKGYSVVGWQ
jgi:outer membrane lipoprotein SlyB